MSYDSESYKGMLAHHQAAVREAADPETPAKASSTTARRFVEVIQALRPDGTPRSGGFGDVLQHSGRPIGVTFNPEAGRLVSAGEQPLGLAAAHNVTQRRRLQWKRGRNPGIYTMTKTVFVEQVWSAGSETASRTYLQAKVQETTRPLAVYGEPDVTIATRPATEDEVVQAIEVVTQAYDAAFMAEAGVTTALTPLSSPDNPMATPPPTVF